MIYKYFICNEELQIFEITMRELNSNGNENDQKNDQRNFYCHLVFKRVLMR
jgi:hypothetical protein